MVKGPNTFTLFILKNLSRIAISYVASAKKKTKTGRIIMEKTEEVCGVSGTQILCIKAKEKKIW